MPEVGIEIPPKSQYVGVVRLAVRSLGRAAGLDEEIADDLRMAVSEACTNSVLAHEAAGVPDSIRVTWNQDGGRIVVDVEDRRTGPDETVAVTDSQGFSSREVMSLALLESLVDECESIDLEGGGNRVRLTVHAPA